MTLTIIEGPDCSGKTTLLNEGFPAREGWVHEHCGPPDSLGPMGAWQQYSGHLLRLWKTRHVMNVVFDRFLYGELIYGPLLRPTTTTLTWAHVRMLERVMLAMQAVTVCAMTTWARTEQLWQERKATELVKSSVLFKQTYEAWEQLFYYNQRLALPKVHYDFQTSNELRGLQHGVNMARGPLNKGPGIGSFRPGVTLMVGEQVNINVARDPQWVFVAPTGSSLWLAEQLEEAKVSEQDLYWVNARCQGQETDPAFIRHLRPARILALGGEARTWCVKNRLQHVALPHPQYWKRFHSKEPYQLIEALGLPQVDLFEEAT